MLHKLFYKNIKGEIVMENLYKELQESYNKIAESDKFIEKSKRQIKFWQIFSIVYIISHIATLIYVIFIK